jgi:tetratricopeptide (TPR) repeat protein
MGDPWMQVQARYLRGISLCTAARFVEAEAVYAEAADLARTDGSPRLRWLVEALSSQFFVARGELEKAERHNDVLRDLGSSLGESDADSWWGAIYASILWARGQVGELADAAAAFAAMYPDSTEWRAGEVWFLAEAGRTDEARASLAASDLDVDLDALADSVLPFHTLAQLCLIAYLLGDVELAERLQTVLEPYVDAWSHYALASIGPIRTSLAFTAATRGDLDAAIGLMERAIAIALDQGWEIARFLHSTYLATFLLDRGRTDDTARARELLEVAEAGAHACGATGWEAQARRQLLRLG